MTTVGFVGLGAINLSQAGVGITSPAGLERPEIHAAKQNAQEIILHIFPENLAKSIAEGDVLQVVVFSVLFGIGVAMAALYRRSTRDKAYVRTGLGGKRAGQDKRGKQDSDHLNVPKGFLSGARRRTSSIKSGFQDGRNQARIVD